MTQEPNADAAAEAAAEVTDEDGAGAEPAQEQDAPAPAEDVTEGEPETADLPEADSVEEDPVAAAERKAEDLTRDLQRLQAEYVNYKRRVDRDRELIQQNATFAALAPIVEVLDNIDRAREHGPLEDGFSAVAEQLERVVANQGLVKFGEPGDAFDPTVHDALSTMGTDAEVTETTVKVVAKAGYCIGDRVVRAAQVLTVEPE